MQALAVMFQISFLLYIVIFQLFFLQAQLPVWLF